MEHGHCCDSDSEHNHSGANYNSLKIKTIIAMIVGGILLYVYMTNTIPDPNATNGLLMNAVVALISFVTLVYCGGHFFSGAWHAFLNHHATMDTLIAIGSGSAWVYSCIVLILGQQLPIEAQHVYFEAAIVIIALVNFGSLIEMRARKQTSTAVSALLNLQPKTARVIRNNAEIDIDVSEIQVNDLIRVRPGEQVPVDGIITEGTATVDESMLTGESTPKTKVINETVIGGTVNQSGTFVFKATKVGSDTVLAKIAELVTQAQHSKPQLARLADKISAIFVPLVLIVAISSALLWYDFGPEPRFSYMLISAMSVLVIACPCALGLAVPISVMIGIGIAAKNGILIKDADALTRLGKITTILIDKTGTLTLGIPKVINVYPVQQHETQEILIVAATLENNSKHPYAIAIQKNVRDELIVDKISDFHEFPGLGVSGMQNSIPVAVGNAAFMKAQLVATDELHSTSRKCAEQGQTFLFVAKNKQLIGGIAIADPIRMQAKEVIHDLQKLGINVLMITGDNYTTAKAVASQLGLDDVVAGVMPEEKAAKIKAYQDEGEVVAMVGDGINDAPALASADVGIAISSGSDIAIQSADVTILGESLNTIVPAIHLSQNCVKNMKQNLFAAFIFNIIGIPIAAGILFPITGMLLNPMIASTAMALSSFTVVTNANKLRLFDTGKQTHDH